MCARIGARVGLYSPIKVVDQVSTALCKGRVLLCRSCVESLVVAHDAWPPHWVVLLCRVVLCSCAWVSLVGDKSQQSWYLLLFRKGGFLCGLYSRLAMLPERRRIHRLILV